LSRSCLFPGVLVGLLSLAGSSLAQAPALPKFAVAQARQPDGGLTCVCLSPDGRTAVSGGGGTIRLWDAASGAEVRQIPTQQSVWTVAFAPDGKTLLAAGSYPALYDPQAGKELRRLEGAQSTVWSAAFSPDGKQVAAGSEDRLVRLWDAATGRLIRSMEGHQSGVWHLAFALDGRTLATGGSDGTVHVWDVAKGTELRRWPAHQGGIWPMAFAPDGRTLATGGYSESLVRVWNVHTGRELGQFQAGVGHGFAMAFSPDGRLLATGGQSSAVDVWEVATGQKRAELGTNTGEGMIVALNFRDDGRRIISGGMGPYVTLWDVTAPARDTAGKPELTEKVLASLKQALAGTDGKAADRAVWTLTQAPVTTVPWLVQEMPQPKAVDLTKVDQLIKDLDDDRYAVREKASEELGQIGDPALPALRKALEGKPSLEMRMRVNRLIEAIESGTGSPDRLLGLRIVETLERIGTPAAREALEAVAKKPPDERVGADARAALKRLER
jgi:Tol biopolymer transport system component